MPTYGRSFTLSNRQNSKVNAPASGGGVAGKYTKEGGFLAYYEVSTAAGRSPAAIAGDRRLPVLGEALNESCY